MKSRVNSRINNTRGKHNYSLHVRKQGFKSESREKALGYCSHHQIYIGEKIFEIKKCSNCRRFIVLQSI